MSKKRIDFMLGVGLLGVGLLGWGVGTLENRELISWHSPKLGIVLVCLGLVIAAWAAYQIKKGGEKKGGKEMATVLNHKELKINLPDGFSLQLEGGTVFLKKSNGRILDAVRYSELTQRKEELERLARQYES